MAQTWNDGRSGLIGRIAGNLVLADLERHQGKFTKVKGTVFESRAGIWVARACSEAYLTAGVLHWANLSWDQFLEFHRLAVSKEINLYYLFVTASTTSPSISYWAIDGNVIKRFLEARGKAQPGAVCGTHIVQKGDDHFLGAIRVTNHHKIVSLTAEQANQITDATRLDQHQKVGEGETPQNAPDDHPQVRQPFVTTITNEISSRPFQIPLSGGRTATLALPLPLADADLARLKGWIDLMGDILTDQGVATD